MTIDADIYGWATRDPLRHTARELLRKATQELRRSLEAFPRDSRSYYERLLRIAEAASAR